jgi:hypothetical protein
MKNNIIDIIIIFFLIYSTVLSQTNNISELNSLEESNSTEISIDVSQAMEKEFEILPKNSYVVNIKTTSVAIFIISPVEDLIHYPSNETCTKLCGVKLSNIKYMYINHFKQLKEKVIIKIISVADTSQIISEKRNHYKFPKFGQSLIKL